MRAAVLTRREAAIFACVCDTVVAPEPVLPAVRDTDAVAFFGDWLARSPRRNRAGLRALLYAAELAPRLLGFEARLTALPEPRRAAALAALERSARPRVRALTRLVKGIACLSYYGDDAVMRRLGYDAAARAPGR